MTRANPSSGRNGHRDGRMVVNRKRARILFGLALGIYLLWLAALVTLAVVSGDRPGDGRRGSATVPQSSSSGPDRPPD
jgi:hypothetical protein